MASSKLFSSNPDLPRDSSSLSPLIPNPPSSIYTPSKDIKPPHHPRRCLEEDVPGLLPPPPPPPPSASDACSSLTNGVSASVAKGKRRAIEEPVDKATLQKQRRMIKNRESAARSRERKQAYTTELEAILQQLEEENARLMEEETERNKQRLKQLRECLIPIVEKPKPKRKLQRSNSV